MGQDIGPYGGVFKVTDGFVDAFGEERVRNTLVRIGHCRRWPWLRLQARRPWWKCNSATLSRAASTKS